MGFFDTLKDRATDLAQAGVAQSKRLAEIAKLKTANMAEEDTIKKAYIELGKLYYAEKGTAPDGAYAAACEKITAAKAAIETNNDRIAELKEGEEDVQEEQPIDFEADPVQPQEEPAAEEPVEEPAAEEAAPVVEEPVEEPAAEEPKE